MSLPRRPRAIPAHGTLYRYHKYRCRCAECQKANTDYCRERRHRLARERKKLGRRFVRLSRVTRQILEDLGRVYEPDFEREDGKQEYTLALPAANG